MEIEKIIAFIKETEKLKSVTRTAWTSTGRRESTAEHSWRLALFAALLGEERPQLDMEKVLLMCLIHDIGEIYEGDVSAALCPDQQQKFLTERRDADSVFSLLPGRQGDRLKAIWAEYNRNDTPEAKLVKALDKAETILQHNQGDNPEDFDYAFNLGYGKDYFEQDQLLGTIRGMLDRETLCRCRQKEAKTAVCRDGGKTQPAGDWEQNGERK